jgi:hypothetical protein
MNALKQRIDSHTDKSGNCWEWTASKRNGYGRIKVDKSMLSVHRLVYEMTNGKISKEMSVCHKCDNPSCVNPDHLFLGTHSDNMRDMVSKNRRDSKGSKNGRSLLTEPSVRIIKKLLLEGFMLQKDIASKFNVSISTISGINQDKTWRHI